MAQVAPSPVVMMPTVVGQFSPTPFPGLPIEPPLVPPKPGQVIVGFQTTKPAVGCCKCETLTPVGWMLLILLIVLFWPLAFAVCFAQDMHQMVQTPVFQDPPKGSNAV